MNPHPHHDPRQSLEAGLTLVRQFVPSATAVHLQVSDHGFDGFHLVNISTVGRLTLSVTDPELLSNLIDDTWCCLRHLPWDGVVGEDDCGTARLELAKGPVPDKTVWTCATCGFFSDQLRADRDDEHLRYDGAHYARWYTEDEEGITYA